MLAGFREFLGFLRLGRRRATAARCGVREKRRGIIFGNVGVGEDDFVLSSIVSIADVTTERVWTNLWESEYVIEDAESVLACKCNAQKRGKGPKVPHRDWE